MTPPTESSDAAFRVADAIRTEAPWEVFAQRIRRYEIHLNGRAIELERAPVLSEGYGIRLLRPRDGKIGTGFQASNDFSEAGIRESVTGAAAVAARSEFPAPSVALPGSVSGGGSTPEILDPALWARPLDSARAYVQSVFSAFDPHPHEAISFGSVKVSLVETSIANSAGARVRYPHTVVETEFAVKATGGPEGAPPGEYWVTDTARRLDPSPLPGLVAEWCRFAQDVRRAKAPPTGDLPVVLPASLTEQILPSVLGYRFTGGARLRELSPKLGAKLAVEGLSIHDDGRFPWAIASGPTDDEGAPAGRHALIRGGAVAELLYDSLRGAAFNAPTTGNAVRGVGFGHRDPVKFAHPPGEHSTTLVIEPGSGGTDAELIEAAGDGIWLQQLGWAVPDTVSGIFGGEIRIGYRIRGGKLAEPVRGGTVGGSALGPEGAPSMLTCLGAIGSKQHLVGDLAAPTLLVRPLAVAGA